LQGDLSFSKQTPVLSTRPIGQTKQHFSGSFRISQSQITLGSTRERLFKLVIKDHGDKVVPARQPL
jgi:hypothetical protein